MIKILQVINSFNTGGAEKLLLDTIPRYNKRGIVVDLALLNGINTPFLKELKEKKICHIYSLSKGTVYNPFLIFKIIPLLKKYDIIHVHLFPSQYYVLFAKLLSLSKVKLIFTEHNTTNRRIKLPFVKHFNKYIYNYYLKTICLTKEIQDKYALYTKLPKENFPIIANGIDLNIINNANPIDKQLIDSSFLNTDALVIQVSGFSEQKDQKTVIKAIGLLPQNVKLILVGDGKFKRDCELFIHEMNLVNKVFLLGNRYDVPQLLKSSNIVVLSTNHEGLSLSCIEGLASNRPFIASNVPGVSEVVKGSGVLFEAGNVKDLAMTINKLLTNREFYNEVATKGLERAKDFSIDKMIDKHIQLYKSICQNPN